MQIRQLRIRAKEKKKEGQREERMAVLAACVGEGGVCKP